MVRYDRRLLIPYLEDVCSVELLYNKVNKEAHEAEKNASHYSDLYRSDIKPIAPKGNHSDDPKGFCSSAVFLLVLAVILFFALESVILGLLALVLSFFAFMYSIESSVEQDQLKKQKEKYEQELIKYNSRHEFDLSQTQEWTRELSIRNKRVAEVQNLRNIIYRVNIIPLPYRNIYAAHFLYDYFRSSQSDDMDHALQMFVLEEIKQKLDRIIEQQTEIILGQRAMLAEQEKMNKALAENHKREMMQLANLNENAARRNQYLEMINANLEVSNFFAFHDYVKRR